MAPPVKTGKNDTPETERSSVRRSTRFSEFKVKRTQIFRVRKSLAEYVDDELEDLNTSVYYQRIYILAKNIAEKTENLSNQSSYSSNVTDAAPLTVTTAMSNETKTSQPARKSQATIAAEMAAEMAAATAAMAETAETATVAATKTEAVKASTPTGEFLEKNASTEEILDTTYDFIDSTTDIREKQSPALPIVAERPKDLFSILLDKLELMANECLDKIYTPDPLCGLLLYMGNYTMLMLEGCEDMIGLFTKDLVNCMSEFWEEARVFQIEDKLSETYFDSLIGRRIPAAYINEKFPTSTPNDEYLMGKEHTIIKEKISLICQMISNDIKHLYDKENEASDNEDNASNVSGETRQTYRRLSENLPIEQYRKLLPEQQRIELVMTSTRFYFTLEEFSKIYGTVPIDTDEDAYSWPVPNNYTPPHIFLRSPYDINLTFGDYNKAVVHGAKETTSATAHE